MHASRDQIQVTVNEQRDVLARLQGERDAFHGQVARLETEKSALKQQKDALHGSLVEGETELAALEERMGIMRERTTSSRARKDALELELARVETERQESAQAIERLSRERQQTQEALVRANELRQRAESLGAEIAALETQLLELGTSRDVLQQTREAALAKLRDNDPLPTVPGKTSTDQTVQ